MTFRKDINGLRAIAVAAVVLFHFNPSWVPGGFAGVDVFFVISGYLITSIILREMEQGKFSIVRFYERRARRILPALFFVIACCFCFLGVVLFLDIWKYFMGSAHPEYWTGLKVVPILMLAKLFLGVYYNLSVWYKLTNQNLIGAWITLGGAAITILINFMLIPYLGYMACAIATICCYGFMMVTSYKLGQKYYPIPYAWKKLTAYVVICVMLFGIHRLGIYFVESIWFSHGLGLALIVAFGLFILRIEKKELQRLPVVGRYI